MFLLKSLFNIPIDYDFVLYKHGPHSFKLSDDLVAFRGDMLLELEPVRGGSPKFKSTEDGQKLKDSFPNTTKRYCEYISFVAKKLGDKGIDELEKISTAIYVINEKPDLKTDNERAEFINRKKRHISITQAKEALKEAHQIIKEKDAER